MNMAQTPTDRPTRWSSTDRRSSIAEPTRVLLIGTRSGIQETIDHLCVLNFCDHAEWSKIQPHPTRPDDYLSTMTKWRI
jgi:hypothetical protein